MRKWKNKIKKEESDFFFFFGKAEYDDKYASKHSLSIIEITMKNRIFTRTKYPAGK